MSKPTLDADAIMARATPTPWAWTRCVFDTYPISIELPLQGETLRAD